MEHEVELELIEVVSIEVLPEQETFDIGLSSVHRFFAGDFLVHNCIAKYHPHGDMSTYQAMVGMAGVRNDTGEYISRNSCVPLVDGYGNWGDNTSDAAAMRYCFSGDTRVMTSDGLVRIDSIPALFGQSNGTTGTTVEFTSKVASLDHALEASHWINSGVRQLYEVKTKRGFTVKATSNEPFYVLNGFDFEWRTLSKLKVGTPLALKRGSDVLPTSGSNLPKFEDNDARRGTYLYEEKDFPTHMSEELAFILGVLVSEGYARYGVGFNNTNRPYFERFLQCWEKVFPNIEYRTSLRDPHSFGKKKSKYFSIPGMQIRAYFEHLGVRFGSYNQVIPEVMFRASRSEMSSFMSALFEGDGSVAGTFVDYHSKSPQLYLDIQNVLLNYYGCVSSIGKSKLYISGSENVLSLLRNLRFCSKAKKTDLDRMLHKVATQPLGNTLSDVIPQSLLEAVSEFKKSVKATKAGFTSESGDKVRFRDSDGVFDMFRFPKATHRVISHVRKNLCIFEKFFPTVARKLQRIIEVDYFYDEIVSITKLGKEPTYDLTVPETHAFVANGFIAHNTESRLSKFADLMMLDPDYVAVMPTVPNFSEDEQMPLVLPAKLPVGLLNGSSSIAVGIAASCPAFEVKGIVEVLKTMLVTNKPLDLKYATRTLKFSFPYGGVCVSPLKDIAHVLKTGTGSLLFRPEFEFDVAKKEFVVTSACPNFVSPGSIQSTFDKIAALKGVASVVDESGKNKTRYVVKLQRTYEDATIKKIESLLTKSDRYDIGMTVRSISGRAKFKRVSVLSMLEEWLKWRVVLEVKVLNRLISVANEKLFKLRTMVLAIDNLQTIIAALKVEDSAAFLMKKLRITKDQADMILDMKVRQLKSLEKKTLIEKIRVLEVEVQTLTKELKTPKKRIHSQLLEMKI